MQTRDLTKAIVFLLLFVLVLSSFYQVREDQFAVTKLFGKINSEVFESGLKFKYPIIEEVYIYDRKIQSLERAEGRFLTVEKKNLIIDYDIRWKINKLKDFYTDVSGSITIANSRIGAIISDVLKSEISRRTVKETIRGDRDDLTKTILSAIREKAENLGIIVVDVRLKRVDFPGAVSDSVFERMIKERATVAKEFRSEGQESSIEIKAKAEREREEILARAYRDSQIARGEGDAKANRIYANAYGKDYAFFKFYRSLEAYRKSFTNGDEILILDSDSEFLKYLKELK